MIIHLSPIRSEGNLFVVKDGDILVINGESFDFTTVPPDGKIEFGSVPHDHIFDDVKRTNGEIHVTLRLPHGPNAPKSILFPKPLINPPDGPLKLYPDTEYENVEA